jgi:putative ABC transport system substrate-binding protein
MIERRAVLAVLALGLVSAPSVARAQQSTRPFRIGFLEAGSRSANQHFADAFRSGLRELGYVEGQNVIVEERWADGKVETFPALLNELIQLKMDVIVPASSAGAVAAKKVTASIPIVFVGVTDPLGLGLVESLARPGSNLTGLSLAFAEGFAGKWIELLKEAVPHASRVVVLRSAQAQANASMTGEIQAAAARLGVKLTSAQVNGVDEFDAAFATMTKNNPGGLIVLTDPMTLRHRTRIVELANTHRLPAMYTFEEFARVGGLMAYGPSVREMFRRAATYVDRILKGAKPADLPVEQPTKFELVINMKTAGALGLKMPPSLLLRADKVIQ